MKKSVLFILLIIFMLLLNLIGYLIGILFIEGYNNYYWGNFYFFESLFLMSLYSFIQIFVFSISKKYREYVIPIITLFLFSFLLFINDEGGFGFEVVDSIVSIISKFIVLFTFITDNIKTDTVRIFFVKLLYSLGYSLYLLMVFSTFKYIIQNLVHKFYRTTMNHE